MPPSEPPAPAPPPSPVLFPEVPTTSPTGPPPPAPPPNPVLFPEVPTTSPTGPAPPVPPPSPVLFPEVPTTSPTGPAPAGPPPGPALFPEVPTTSPNKISMPRTGPTPAGPPPRPASVSEFPPTFPLKPKALRMQNDGNNYGQGAVTHMMMSVGTLNPEDSADALNTANSTTTAFPTARQLMDVLPPYLHHMVPPCSRFHPGSVRNFKAFIRELALEGEDVNGKLSIPTQVAVLSTLALFYTQGWLFRDEQKDWEARKEREDHAVHYAKFEADYGCGDDCTHPEHSGEGRFHNASERALQEGFSGEVESAEGPIDAAEVREIVRNNEILGEDDRNEDEHAMYAVEDFDVNGVDDPELDAV